MHVQRWKLVISGLLTLVIIALAYFNRAWLVEAFGLLRTAQPGWIAGACVLVFFSYFISSQVFNIVLRSLGYQMGFFRLWITAIVAIVISQSVPAGGVGSYAFLVSNFSRRGVPAGQSALIASLETMSYACAMLLMFSFSMLYLALHDLGANPTSLLAGLVAIVVISSAVFVLTRSEATMRAWLGGLHRGVARLLRRPLKEAWIENIVGELAMGRQLIVSQPRDVFLLVLVQLTALSGHSIAMMMIFYAFGVPVSFAIVATAFGIALITSTFNVLPGGGGTVEAALVAVLSAMGGGAAAVPASIIFRLINFWLLVPVTAAGYHWLMHERVRPLVARRDAQISSE